MSYDLSPGYTFTASDEGVIELMNQNLLTALGYTEGSALKLDALLTPGSRIFFEVHFFPLIKLQGKANEIFLSFLTKSGESLPVLLNIIRVYEDGTYKLYGAGLAIAQRNKFEKEIIDARIKAESALFENATVVLLNQELEAKQIQIEQQLQKIADLSAQQGQIEKVLAHDLQEPLRKISLFASLMKSGTSDLETNLNKILKASQRLRNLLIRMQRLHALTNVSLKIKAIDLNKLIEASEKRCRAKAIPFNIIVENKVVFNADFNLLVNLFEELIDNSIKFSKPGIAATIKITSDYFMHDIFIETENKYRYEEYVRLSYSDNGIGFDNKYAAQLFDLFAKLHTNEDLGIGLTHAKGIVKLHNGFINIYSNSRNGIAITILLPKL